MKRNPVYIMGSISSGTMRPEDLIPAFADELDYLSKENRVKGYRRLINRIVKASANKDYFDSEEASWELDELFDALQEFAPPYFYFGAHPGDGVDYGFWLTENFEYDFDGLKVNDLSEVPRSYRGEVLEVNDHGNMTLWLKNSHGFREVWAIV